MLPNFLVIGAQKSGTTFFLNCLREHPDIFMPQNEVRFFEDPEYLKSDISQLEALFQNISSEKVIGIKRPAYLAKPECPERIYKHIPNAKLIVTLRNPIERAVSAYFHSMACSFIPIRSLEEGMTKIINEEYKNLYPLAEEIINFGFYHHYLMRYLQYFERDQLLITLFDDIKTNPLESIKQLYRFVGVSDEYIPQSLGNRSQQNPGMYSLTRLRLFTIRNPIVYDNYNTRNRSRKSMNLLERAINRMILEADRLLLTPICNNSKPKLSAHLTNSLLKIYEEEINRLEDFLGRELTSWKSSGYNSEAAPPKLASLSTP